MRPLYILVAVVVTISSVIATPVDEAKIDKRLLGELIGGLLGGEGGGLLGGLLGGEGGLPGELLGGLMGGFRGGGGRLRNVSVVKEDEKDKPFVNQVLLAFSIVLGSLSFDLANVNKGEDLINGHIRYCLFIFCQVCRQLPNIENNHRCQDYCNNHEKVKTEVRSFSW